MKSLFFRDSITDTSFDWQYLIEDLNCETVYNPYCKSENFYIIFKRIILSILLNEKIILLDSDFSDYELKNLIGFSEFDDYNVSICNNRINIKNKSDLLNKLMNSSKEWKITLFTSGTTGLPKMITHDFYSITRFVRVSNKYVNNIWGFAYNPTHMAGVQVFFQALLNGNSIIRLFGLRNENIYSEISGYKITHISATPSFFKLMLADAGVFDNVEKIISGGEKYNEKIFSHLLKIFPNAKTTNIYASTEVGTLFISNNDIFSPQVEYEQYVKVESNELLIHSILMGNRIDIIGDWYNTGDLVEVLSERPLKFRFLNRKSEMINVGGYKVNPLEVEELILNFPGVKDTRVFAKKNSVLGNIVCCEIVGEKIIEAELRNFLKNKIQDYKIPRLFNFVNLLQTTRTGKLKRN